MGLLYSSTGFVLQQCAYNNCVLHFSRIIEHKDLTIDDLIYTGEDKENDNPLMIAAKLRNKEIITTVFRSAKFKHSDNSKLCGELIHARNKDNQTLLAMVALQGIIFYYLSVFGACPMEFQVIYHSNFIIMWYRSISCFK